MTLPAFPLTWPPHFPRTKYREDGRFKTALPNAIKNVQTSLRGFASDSGKAPAPRSWREVLGVDGNANLEAARSAYKRLASANHPDRGGDAQTMAEINAAFAQAERELTGA